MCNLMKHLYKIISVFFLTASWFSNINKRFNLVEYKKSFICIYLVLLIILSK